MLSFLHHPKTNAANASFNLTLNRRPKHILILLLPFFAILAQAPFVAVRGQNRTPILVLSVLPGTICFSSSPALVDVVFTGRGYADGNVFTALLSGPGIVLDTIGTLNSAGGLLNVIHAKIPANAPAGAYRIRVQASNPGNVSDITGSLIITGLNAPTLTLTKQDVSCGGNGFDGIITGVATGGNAPYTFSFLPRTGDRQRTPNSLTVSNLAPMNNYTMRVTDDNGCIVQEDTDLIKLPAPSIEVSTQGNVSSCGTGGGFFTLRVFPRTGTIATATKPYSFQEVPQGTDTTGVAYVTKPVPVTFDNLATGSYMVTMKDGSGCKSTNTINNIVIGTDGPLAITLSGYGNPTSCGGTDGDITVQNTGGSGSTYRYSISKDGGAFSAPQSGRRFGGLGGGTYTIQGMDSRGCTDTLHKRLNNPKGCATIASSTDAFRVTAKNALKLQVFPNPAKTTFTLNVQSNNRESVQIVVTDMVGKKIYQTTGSSNRQYIFGQEFKPGIYIVQVIQGKQIQTLKLIKGN